MVIHRHGLRRDRLARGAQLDYTAVIDCAEIERRGAGAGEGGIAIEGGDIISKTSKAARVARPAPRHVLMVAFHFPPIAASAGALRSRAFVDYLPEHDWQPHVLAPVCAAYEEIDAHSQVPAQVPVRRAWALDARRHMGWRGRYAAVIATPDRWVSWAPGAIREGLRIVRDHPIEAIWSTYPIATSHLIASVIARQSGLPWIAEFRDPVQPTGGRLPARSQQAIERRAMHHAARLVFVTPGARAAAARRFPESASRMDLIANGYDEALEQPADLQEQPTQSAPIVLLHSGHLYPDGRDPGTLLKAVARLKETAAVSADTLQIILRNTQQDERVAPVIEALGIGDIVQLAPRLAHDQAMSEQRRAHGLILLQGRLFDNQVPAKLFEYLRSSRPVLALVHPGGDTAGLLAELQAGFVLDIDDVEALTRGLARFLARLADHPDGDPAWQASAERLAGYSRRAQTAAFAGVLDSVVAHAEDIA